MRKALGLICALTGAAFVLAALHPPALLGQRGTVVGTIRDQSTTQPLEAVRVQVVGTTIGGTTDQRGHFIVRLAPAGSQQIRLTRIGYRPMTQSVTIPANDSAAVNVNMATSAVELSAVVTTGTGGAVDKTRVGSSMGVVDFAVLREQIPVADLGTSLSAKVTGLRSESVGGGAGGQKDIRIRGIASFSLDQRPTIYIDGVRIDKARDEWTGGLGAGGMACCSFAGGNSVDRLNDLNPDDIERIEVLKGAAAATLYGSDATNGVIQIFTKHGKSDATPTWSVSYTTGFDQLRKNIPTTLFPRFVGTDGTRARDANDLIGSGLYSAVDVSVQGGGQRNTYYISTGYMDEEGSIQPNWERRANLRLNLSFLPTDKWTIEGRSIFTKNRVAELQAGNNWTALLGNAMNGNPRNATKDKPFGEAWVSVADIQTMDTFSDANRWTGGLTVNYAQTASLTHRLIAGLDVTDEQKSRFFPWAGSFGPAGVTNGQKNEAYRKYSNFTLDYLSQWHAKFPFGILSDFSFGGQGYWEKTDLNLATGNGFAGPGVNLVSAASVKSGGEGYTEVVNIGGLAQERLSFGDRLFVTTGLRIDGNTAFGQNFGFKAYPKIDFSYLLSGYSWMPKAVSSLKLRGAIGMAGKAPGAFDKFTTFNPISVYGGTPAVVPFNPGNPDIRPETATEKEIGFESGFLGDRVGLEGSYYFATTRDALLGRANPPSAGFTQSRNVNIGAIQNTGWEASLNILAISNRLMDWTTTFRLDGNHNKIVDMGTVPQTGSRRVGYPVNGVWGRVLKPCTGPNGPAAGVTANPGVNCGYGVVNQKPAFVLTDTNVYIGPPLPTFNATWANTMRLGAFSLYVNVGMERGAFLSNGDRSYRVRQGGSDEYLQFLKPNADGTCPVATCNTFQADSVYNWWLIASSYDSRDHVRFREFAITWSVPERYTVGRHLGKMSVTVSGQNLMWWDNCHCVDPSMAYAGGTSFGISEGFLAQPSPRQFRLAIRSRL